MQLSYKLREKYLRIKWHCFPLGSFPREGHTLWVGPNENQSKTKVLMLLGEITFGQPVTARAARRPAGPLLPQSGGGHKSQATTCIPTSRLSKPTPPLRECLIRFESSRETQPLSNLTPHGESLNRGVQISSGTTRTAVVPDEKYRMRDGASCGRSTN